MVDRRPAVTGIAAATSSPASLMSAWISKRSSSRPTPAHTQAPSRIAFARPPSDGCSSSTAPRRPRTSRCRRRRGSGSSAGAGPSCGGPRDRRAPRSAPRSRQPEREYAGQGERDERVEARLGHGRAPTVSRRKACPPDRTSHGRTSCRASALHTRRTPLLADPRGRPSRRCGRSQQRHGEARRVARAHAHDDLPQPALSFTARARRARLLRRRREAADAPNSIAPMSGPPAVRAKLKKSGARGERGIRAVEQEGARGRRRALGVEMRVADDVGRHRPGRSRRRCARCGCGRTSRAALAGVVDDQRPLFERELAYARPKRSELERPEITVLLTTAMLRGRSAAGVRSPPTKMPTCWPASGR